ncbi:MAG: helix-turn-helix domain-containing protein, partial [Gammaproteobacteria bacterium]|nr:helix-turn-helix domain-containing protein [Gammaproteobacteria bacterium]
MHSKSLMTTSEAATVIGMSRAFLERDRWAGATIPFIRIGQRAVRYRREDLDRFIESRVRHSTSDQS